MVKTIFILFSKPFWFVLSLGSKIQNLQINEAWDLSRSSFLPIIMTNFKSTGTVPLNSNQLGDI